MKTSNRIAKDFLDKNIMWMGGAPIDEARTLARAYLKLNVKTAKAERRVIRTAMRLHAYKPKHGFGEIYESHKEYLFSQLHRACDALNKVRRIDSGKATP